MQAAIIELLACAKAAWDEEGVHVRPVGEGVVGHDGEASLCLDRPERFGD